MKSLYAAIIAGLLVVGCAATSSSEQAPGQDESQIRAIAPEELLGEIKYGETKEVTVTPAPHYRAYSFVAEKFDYIQAQVMTQNATDPVLWLLDSDWNTVAMNNDVSATDTNSALNGRVLMKAGTYYLVFRELNSKPISELTVSLRKLGAIPAQCDPDGEGLFAPDCTAPPNVDPFKPESCTGDPLTTADATTKFAGPNGLRLSDGRVYYQTRQCRDVAGTAQCSSWVRAWPMDVRIGSIVIDPASPTTFTLKPADATRKTKIDISLEPATTKSFCVDGPFYDVRGETWGPLADGLGVCGTQATAVVTKTCTRIEAQPIQVKAGNDPTYYTEFGAVLLASY